MIGTISASISFCTFVMSIAVMSPTKPRSIFAPGASTRGGAFSRDQHFLAGKNLRLAAEFPILAASEGLITSVNTRSMILIEASSVTRRPSTNLRGQVFLPHRRGDRLAAAVHHDRD